MPQLLSCSICRQPLPPLPAGIPVSKNPICPNCARDTAPAADPKKLEEKVKKINGHNKLPKDIQFLLERIKSLEVKFDLKMIDGKIILWAGVLDYFKKEFFGFSLDKQFLENVLIDIKKAEDENSNEEVKP
jgi:hypothetical protein